MAEHPNDDVKDLHQPMPDDASTAERLGHHEAMLMDHHARLGAVEKHLGIKTEAGVAKEETQGKATEKATKREASRERRRH